MQLTTGPVTFTVVLALAGCSAPDDTAGPGDAGDGGPDDTAGLEDAGSRDGGPDDSTGLEDAGLRDGGQPTPILDAGDDDDAGEPQLFLPPVGTTWQWQLSGYPVDTGIDVAMYDVDLVEASEATLQALRSDRRAIICYFSAGSWESYRPDANAFPADVLGAPLDPPFADELWVDYREPVVREIMQSRLDLAVTRGCDGVEPDNVDGFANGGGGLGLTAADQLEYNRWLAAEAHARRLSVGLKNDLDQLDQLVDDFDWALNEECFSFNECEVYVNNFLLAGKAVFHAEYVGVDRLSEVCAITQPLGLSTLIKNIDLDAPVTTCP